jgi:hypothetical protein
LFIYIYNMYLFVIIYEFHFYLIRRDEGKFFHFEHCRSCDLGYNFFFGEANIHETGLMYFHGPVVGGLIMIVCNALWLG